MQRYGPIFILYTGFSETYNFQTQADAGIPLPNIKKIGALLKFRKLGLKYLFQCQFRFGGHTVKELYTLLFAICVLIQEKVSLIFCICDIGC